MGEKKKKEESQKKWKKILFVIAAVLFVVVMVISSMGMNWISGLAPVRPGDQVLIDFTMYNSAGTPFITTSQQLYKQQYSSGKGIMYAKPLTLTANQSLKQVIYPVQVYVAENGGSWEEFALYNAEYNALSNGVVGMRANEKKTVLFSSASSMSAFFSPEEMASAHVNITTLEVGDSLAMGVSETPNATASNVSTVSYIRLGEITRKSPQGVVVDFGYPSAEITVNSFTSR